MSHNREQPLTLYSGSSQPASERRTFERQLTRLEREVLLMGALVENACRLSHQALFARDLDAAREITNIDEQIDRYYRKIEADCLLVITLQHPAAQDSRLLGAFMQLVRDLERIGDYAEDLAEIAVKLFPYPVHECMSDIEEMSNCTQSMIAECLLALTELDAEAGSKLKEQDSTVDRAYDQLYCRLAYQRDVKGSIEPLLLLTLTIRHLERMADHATNVGQRVSYIVTGRRG